MFFDKVSNKYACDDSVFNFNMMHDRQHIFLKITVNVFNCLAKGQHMYSWKNIAKIFSLKLLTRRA